jgi:hypothetical protein
MAMSPTRILAMALTLSTAIFVGIYTRGAFPSSSYNTGVASCEEANNTTAADAKDATPVSPVKTPETKVDVDALQKSASLLKTKEAEIKSLNKQLQETQAKDKETIAKLQKENEENKGNEAAAQKYKVHTTDKAKNKLCKFLKHVVAKSGGKSPDVQERIEFSKSMRGHFAHRIMGSFEDIFREPTQKEEEIDDIKNMKATFILDVDKKGISSLWKLEKNCRDPAVAAKFSAEQIDMMAFFTRADTNDLLYQADDLEVDAGLEADFDSDVEDNIETVCNHNTRSSILRVCSAPSQWREPPLDQKSTQDLQDDDALVASVKKFNCDVVVPIARLIGGLKLEDFRKSLAATCEGEKDQSSNDLAMALWIHRMTNKDAGWLNNPVLYRLKDNDEDWLSLNPAVYKGLTAKLKIPEWAKAA